MRLSILDNGHNLSQKIIFKLSKRRMGGHVAGPILTMSYRRKFFGMNMAKWFQSAMRNLEHWTLVEAEIIATFVSNKNKCQYCGTDHGVVVEVATRNSITKEMISNFENENINSKLKMVLPFIEKLTLSPESITQSDILTLLENGLEESALKEAVNICGAFCVINRLADSFDFQMSVNSKKVATFLYKYGYTAASIPW